MCKTEAFPYVPQFNCKEKNYFNVNYNNNSNDDDNNNKSQQTVCKLWPTTRPPLTSALPSRATALLLITPCEFTAAKAARCRSFTLLSSF